VLIKTLKTSKSLDQNIASKAKKNEHFSTAYKSKIIIIKTLLFKKPPSKSSSSTYSSSSYKGDFVERNKVMNVR